MVYVDGFVIAVPTENKAAYVQAARQASQVFLDHGALRVVECWGDDVPDGKVTDFKGAVKAEASETVLFSWIEWPDRETRDSGNESAMNDERMSHDADSMPFDGQRMIYAGFQTILDEGR